MQLDKLAGGLSNSLVESQPEFSGNIQLENCQLELHPSQLYSLPGSFPPRNRIPILLVGAWDLDSEQQKKEVQPFGQNIRNFGH